MGYIKFSHIQLYHGPLSLNGVITTAMTQTTAVNSELCRPMELHRGFNSTEGSSIINQFGKTWSCVIQSLASSNQQFLSAQHKSTSSMACAMFGNDHNMDTRQIMFPLNLNYGWKTICQMVFCLGLAGKNWHLMPSEANMWAEYVTGIGI